MLEAELKDLLQQPWYVLFGLGAFALAWSVCLLSLLAGLFEGFIAARFSPKVFDLGFIVYRREEASDQRTFKSNIGKGGETENGKFVILDARNCLFRKRRGAFRFTVNTPFQLKGKATLHENRIRITGRAPFFYVIASICWMAGWMIAGIFVLLIGQNMSLNQRIILGPLGILFAWVLSLWSIWIERRRLSLLWRELREPIDRMRTE